MPRHGLKVAILIIAFVLSPLLSHAVVEEKSSILGSLLDSASKPLSGVTVRLLDSFFLDEIGKTTTDKFGKFALSGLVPGLYLISIETSSLPSLMKRVQVVSGSPTIIDIKALLSEEELKKQSGWDRFKWTIKVAQRNPLRDDETIVQTEETATAGMNYEGFFGALKNFQESNNIAGEFSYVSMDSSSSNTGLSQSAQFAFQGEWEGEGSWSFGGNFLGGVRSGYAATGEVEYQLADHQIGANFAANDLLLARFPGLTERQRITRFMQTPETDEIAEESKLWITSLDLEDQWQLFDSMSVGYGTRIDYYGYLADPVHYSPRAEVAYSVAPTVQIRGMYYRNTSAPGNYYLQPDEVHPYFHDIAFVPYNGSLNPEITTGYKAGLEYTAGGMQLTAYYEEEDVTNKIATVDLSNSPVNETLQSVRPFVIFNAKDLSSRGVEFGFSKQVSSNITAVASYNVTQAVPIYIVEKRVFSERQMFFVNGRYPEEFHDVGAGIRAQFLPTKTQVVADWKWSSGSPVVFGRKQDSSSMSAIDVEVYQGMPFRVFAQSNMKLLLAIKNLLDQTPDTLGNADFQRALIYGMPRIVAGGVLIEF
jgi:TonB dependent receptor/Carboxypeptidase regulatory-like domain